MKTMRIVGLSVLSTLLTVATILALLSTSGAAIAQNPNPPTGGQAPLTGAAQGIPGSVPAAPNAAPEDTLAPAATTDYLHISPMALMQFSIADDRYIDGSQCVYFSGIDGRASYPVALPFGTTITSIRLYYDDNLDPQQAVLLLMQYDDGFAVTELARVATPVGTAKSWSTISIQVPLDYVNYSYNLVWVPGLPGNGMRICGFRIGYTRPLFGAAALPMVTKGTP